jgi:hypothetical protein
MQTSKTLVRQEDDIHYLLIPKNLRLIIPQKKTRAIIAGINAIGPPLSQIWWIGVN